MNLRHAAALTLVGWYLMSPPWKDSTHSEWLIHAPLSQWVVIDQFDTAAECKQNWMFWFHGWLAEKPPKDPKDEEAVYEHLKGQCVATDDPRLKEK
jgi:hypothetical protein